MLGVNPKILAYTNNGIKIVLIIRKEVYIPVFVKRLDEKLLGRIHPTNLSTINPNKKLVRPATMMTTYWMACYM